MGEMIELLATIVRETRFEDKNIGIFTPAVLRKILRSDKLRGNISSARWAEPKVPEHLLTEFTDQLRQLLSDYLEPETGRIGNGLVDLMGGSPSLEIGAFAKNLIRGAATLGPERVVKLLFGWIEGEPFHYKAKALLLGVNIDQPLELEEGIHLSALPNSPADIPPHLPPFSMHRGYVDFLRCVVLSIDCKAEPAFYLPLKGESSRKFKHTWANGKIPELSIDTFCEALSLACNNHVYWKFFWRDFEGLEELNPGFSGMSHADVPIWGSGIFLLQEHLEQAREIHLTRSSFVEKSRHLDTTVSRWMKSKRSNATLADRFIDLRIALEALYLENDHEGEKRFRLALRGAWHLGANLAERKKHYETLLNAYSRASRFVHAGEKDVKKQDGDLLAAAQDVCREGILKRLKEKQKPDWNNIILGMFEEIDLAVQNPDFDGLEL